MKSRFGFPRAEKLTNAVLRERIAFLERLLKKKTLSKDLRSAAEKRLYLYKLDLGKGLYSARPKRKKTSKRAA